MFVDPLVKTYGSLTTHKEVKVDTGTKRRPKQDKKNKGTVAGKRVDLKV